MAKNAYIGIAAVARKVKQPYFGVGGVARKVKAGYFGVGGVARQFFAGEVSLGGLAAGTIVKMNVNGTPTNFIVVHNGLPSSIYDSSCNGTWLLMEDLYVGRKYDSTDNVYPNSDIHTYLNGTFLNLFDSGIKSAIKQVKIPYYYNGSVYSGANGLSAKIFLLSGYELGWTTSNGTNFPVDGAKLDYFSSGVSTAANNLRIGYLSGTATSWFTRSPCIGSTSYMLNLVGTSGQMDSGSAKAAYAVRPALIIPSTTLVDDNYNVIA